MIRLRYDPARHGFHAWAAGVLGVDDLSRLHELLPPAPGVPAPRHALELRARLKAAAEPALAELAARFVGEVVEPAWGPVGSHQRPPTLRVHLHGGGSVSAFHRDGDGGQPAWVENVWIPFTPVWGSNSLWVESEPGRGDFAPLELDYGEAVVFRGALLRHGSLDNLSGATRVSADLRILARRARPD